MPGFNQSYNETDDLLEKSRNQKGRIGNYETLNAPEGKSQNIRAFTGISIQIIMHRINK